MERKQWRPSRWSEQDVRLKLRRVYRQALKDMGELIGPHNARIIYAELVANMKAEQSRVELHRRGIALLGDSQP